MLASVHRLATAFTLVLLLTGLACKEKKGADMDSDPFVEQTQAALPVPNPVQVHPVSHASAVLRWDGRTVYMDPVGHVALYSAYPAPDLIVVTDIHGDHFSPETLEALGNEGTEIIVPEAVFAQMRNALAERATVLANDSVLTAAGITVTAIPMYNLREEARDFHIKGRGNGYVLERDGYRVYISGDTEDIPEMRALRDIDMAFVCMNLPYTMTVDRAADAVLEFRPARVYPYHYRGNPDVSDVAEFRSRVEAGGGSVQVVQMDWYPDAPY